MILLVWVDDFASMSTTDDQNNATEHDLNSHFNVKSLRQPNLLLGLKISQGNHIVTLSQTHYINTLLEKFGLTNVNLVSTPMDINIKLDNVAVMRSMVKWPCNFSFYYLFINCRRH